MKKHSKRYSISKKLEYEQALRKSKRYMDYEKIKAYENQILSRNLSKLLQSSDSPDFTSAQVVADTSHAARIRYKNTLSSSTKDILDLGIKHTVSDLLYTLPRVRRAFDSAPASYTSFGQAQGSMSDFVLGSDDGDNHSVAEFNKFDDLSKKEQDAIRRAEEELYRISYSLEELEDKGLLTAQEGKQYRTERMTYEERYRFLYLLRNVDNFMQKAQASKFTFIADTYIERRQGVLVEDFGGKYDKYIREKIKEFLQAESRYMSSVERRGELTDDLRRNIETKLKEFDRKVNKSSKSYTNSSKARAEYENRAEMIIATEVSTAYNFGKLIGFSGMQDLEKKFIWNADWELQFTSQYYEVCEHCKSMDGREFTVRELLVIGTQLDVGAGGFGRSGRRTDFKNPSLPMIPSHPHCLTPEMQVLCYNGEYKQIQNIQVGQVVLSPSSQLEHRVTFVHKNRFDGKVYTIRFDNGTESTYTGNHPIRISKGWCNAGDVRSGDIAFEYAPKSSPSFRAIQTVSKTVPSVSRAAHIRRNYDSDIETNYPTSNNKGCTVSEKSDCGKTQRIIGKDALEKPDTHARSNREDNGHAASQREWHKDSTLQVFNRARTLSSRYARRFTAFLSQQLGSKYRQDFKSLRINMGVREGGPVNKALQLFSRFLLTGPQLVHRSKGILDIGCKEEIQTCSKEIPVYELTVDRPKVVQEMPIDVQRLSTVRVTSIEESDYIGYVYNLEVEGSHTFFVNSILSHNCNCHFTLQQDDRRFESEDIYEDIPIEEINKLDPQRQIIPSTKGNLALQLAGAGLVVGGAFLLSRSNLWNTFAAALANRNPVPFKQIGDVVGDTLKYVSDEFSDEVGVAVSNTVRDVVNSPPQLPITKVRAVSLV